MKPPLEKDVQKAVLAFLRARRIFALHIPNGSVLAGDQAARARQMNALKSAGMHKGAPDLLLIQRTPTGSRIGFMEIKREGGRLTEEQKDFADLCQDWNIPWATVRSIDDARETLEQWGWGLEARSIGEIIGPLAAAIRQIDEAA